MAEVYWMALTRDVPFSEYGTDPMTILAAGEQYHDIIWELKASPTR